MTLQEKIKLARQVMNISAIFSLVVAAVLLINFIQLKRYEPLESETLNYLVEQLKDEPQNEKLMEEIRNFDLVVRKAYFTSEWQVKSGTYLLLFGGIIFALSLRIVTDLKKRIGVPEADKESFLLGRKKSWHWLLASGIILFGLGLAAGYTGKSHLEQYYSMARDTENENPEEEIEIVRITNPNVPAGEMNTIQDSTVQLADIAEATGSSDLPDQKPESIAAPAAEKAVQQEEKPYGLAEFKKYHNTFRGPWGQGIAYHKNIPVSWDGDAGTNVIWKVAISKPGYNSPVTWGNKLFLAGADAEARIVSCYDKNTGQLLWEKKADNIPGSPSTMPKVTDDTGLSAPTLAVDGYRVYAIFATGDVIAFDLNGNRVWARNLGVPKNHYGHSSSLMVWNGKLIIQYDTGSGGRLLALKVASGETTWDVKRDNKISWASPLLMEVNGKMQIVTTADPNVSGTDLETGEELWKAAVMMGEVGPSCACYNGMVYANNEYASLVALQAGPPDPTPLWEQYDYLSEAASPVAYNGLLFLATSYGVLVCYDATSGDEVWQKEMNVTFYSSPMVVESKLYLMDNSGTMHIVKADRTGEIIAEPSLGEASYAIPAFDDGRIYIRGSESLYCIGK